MLGALQDACLLNFHAIPTGSHGAPVFAHRLGRIRRTEI